MKLEFCINNRQSAFFVVLAVFIATAGVVVAYNSSSTGTPSVMGHSFDEIELPSCSTGEVLKKTATGWGCGADAGSTLDCYRTEPSFSSIVVKNNACASTFLACPSGYKLVNLECGHDYPNSPSCWSSEKAYGSTYLDTDPILSGAKCCWAGSNNVKVCAMAICCKIA